MSQPTFGSQLLTGDDLRIVGEIAEAMRVSKAGRGVTGYTTVAGQLAEKWPNISHEKMRWLLEMADDFAEIRDGLHVILYG